MAELLLGVNIDHVATLRQARMTDYPDPIEAARLVEAAGADAITVHLREDRRHIQDSDVSHLKQMLNIRLNLEMAVTEEMVAIATQLRPADCCLVPEKRQELTTEGGLDVRGQFERVKGACAELARAEVRVSLFIDPDSDQIDAAVDAGAPVIELHTGAYAEAPEGAQRQAELRKIQQAARYAHQRGLQVNAGHGLHYQNTTAIAQIPELVELNIGHSMVARALMVGMPQAVEEMRRLLQQAREA